LTPTVCTIVHAKPEAAVSLRARVTGAAGAAGVAGCSEDGSVTWGKTMMMQGIFRRFKQVGWKRTVIASFAFTTAFGGWTHGQTPSQQRSPASQATTRPAPFIYYDATSYDRKPPRLFLRGLWPAVCETWGTVEDFARRAVAERAILILDLEPLPAYGSASDEQVQAMLTDYAASVDRARAIAPTLAIGCYHFPHNERELRTRMPDGSWDERGFADRLNFSAPQVYFYRDQTFEQWSAEAEKRLANARTYQRPMYAFLNTTHFTPPYEDVDEELLRRGIEFIRARADGIIWWGGSRYQKALGGREVYQRYNWREDATWLKAMRPAEPAVPAPATGPAALP
jgi:hypothetical protein